MCSIGFLNSDQRESRRGEPADEHANVTTVNTTGPTTSRTRIRRACHQPGATCSSHSRRIAPTAYSAVSFTSSPIDMNRAASSQRRRRASHEATRAGASAIMSRTPIRPWTIVRLSSEARNTASSASHSLPPAARMAKNSASRATIPAMTLGIRHPMPLSPNAAIEPAIRSLPSGGCSLLGSRSFSRSPYLPPSGMSYPRITRAAFT